MSKKKKISGECAYCGKPATTLDHVPPQGLFAKPRIGLIKVPACQKCNNGTSLDDEFLKRLSLNSGAERSRDAIQTSESLLRSIARPEAQRMKQGLFETIKPVNVWSTSGLLWLGKSYKMTLDGERMSRIVRKVIRGLYFHVTGKRLPPQYVVETHVVGREVPTESIRENERQILDVSETIIGDQAFSFRYVLAPQDEFLSVWRLEFYGVSRYMGYTILRQEHESTFLSLQDFPEEPASPLATD